MKWRWDYLEARVKILLELGATPNIKAGKNLYPIELVPHESISLANLLLDHGADTMQLLQSVRNNDFLKLAGLKV